MALPAIKSVADANEFMKDSVKAFAAANKNPDAPFSIELGSAAVPDRKEAVGESKLRLSNSYKEYAKALLKQSGGDINQALLMNRAGPGLENALRAAVGTNGQQIARLNASFPTRGDVHVDTFMSNIFLMAAPTMFHATQSLPVVTVRRSSGKFSKIDSGRLRQNYGTQALRPDGEVANEVYVRYGEDNYETKTYSLRCIVADAVIDNADNPLRPFIDAGLACSLPLFTFLDNTVGSILNTTANYTTTFSASDALTGSGVNTIEVVENDLAGVRRLSTKWPNRMIGNDKTIRKIVNHESIRKGAEGDGRNWFVSPDRRRALAAEVMGVDTIVPWFSTENTATIPNNPTDPGNTGLTLADNFAEDKVAIIYAGTALMRNTAFGVIIVNGNRNFRITRYRLPERSAEVVEVTAEFVVKILDPNCGAYYENA